MSEQAKEYLKNNQYPFEDNEIIGFDETDPYHFEEVIWFMEAYHQFRLSQVTEEEFTQPEAWVGDYSQYLIEALADFLGDEHVDWWMKTDGLKDHEDLHINMAKAAHQVFKRETLKNNN